MRLSLSWTPALLLSGLFLTVASSAVIPFQPAPTDYILLATFALWLLLARPKRWMPVLPLAFLGLWVLTDLVQLTFWKLPDPAAARFFTTLDVLMVLLTVLLISLLRSYPRPALYSILWAFLVAAITSVVPSLLTLMGVWQLEQTLFGKIRLRGFFNYPGDTNDFGLFMGIALVFGLYLGRYGPPRFRLVGYLCSPLLLAGVVLSYSRAAWVVTVVVLLLLLLLNFFSFKRWYLVWLALGIGVGMAGLVLLQQPRLLSYFQTRFSLQYYDQDRFGYNQKALEAALTNPLGVGVGQTKALLNYVVHNHYIRLLYESGWIGFLAVMGFLLLTLHRLLHKLRTPSTTRPIFVMLLALVVGLLVNTMVVDPSTNRFHWLVLALVWGEYQSPQ